MNQSILGVSLYSSINTETKGGTRESAVKGMEEENGVMTGFGVIHNNNNKDNTMTRTRTSFPGWKKEGLDIDGLTEYIEPRSSSVALLSPRDAGVRSRQYQTIKWA